MNACRRPVPVPRRLSSITRCRFHAKDSPRWKTVRQAEAPQTSSAQCSKQYGRQTDRPMDAVVSQKTNNSSSSQSTAVRPSRRTGSFLAAAFNYKMQISLQTSLPPSTRREDLPQSSIVTTSSHEAKAWLSSAASTTSSAHHHRR